MKNSRSYLPATALGTFTAVAALLVGMSGAQAQAVAPAPPLSGAGSFPGSFIVPGTNTSLHVGGIIQLDTTYDFDSSGAVSPGAYQNLYAGGVALKNEVQSNGVTIQAETSAQAQSGTFRINPSATHPFFETRTPTDYGELKTFWEMNFTGSYSGSGGAAGGGSTGNDYGLSSIGITGTGNGYTPKLTQAYGTLGPWLFGQTNSNFADLDSLADQLDAFIEEGLASGAGIAKNPQIRYTYLLPYGISVGGSIEEVTTAGIFAGVAQASSTAAPGFTTAFNAIGTGQFEFNNVNEPGMSMRIPGMTLKIRIDQPWGHDQLALAVQQQHIQNFGGSTELGSIVTGTTGAPVTLPSPVGLGSIPTGGHIGAWGGVIAETGHFNTFGKDKATWNLSYGQGAPSYQWALFQGGTQFEEGLVCSITTPAAAAAGAGNAAAESYHCSQPRVMGINVGYSHWWNDTWRSGVSFGFDRISRPDAAGGWANANLNILERQHQSAAANIQWTPVPAAQLGLEFEFYRRYVWSGDEGTAERLDFQTLFKF